MKPVPPFLRSRMQCRALLASAVGLSVLLHCELHATPPVPLQKPDRYPSWWFVREVIKRDALNPSNPAPVWGSSDYPDMNDFGALNAGQLRHLASKGFEELEAVLPGGAGTALSDLIMGFGTSLTQVSGVTASQSSTYSIGAAAAIDNNTDGNYYNWSVTHTNLDTNPWLQIDLGSSRTIHNVEVWNRTDDAGYRLANWYVFVSATDMSQSTLPALLEASAVWKSAKITSAPNPNVKVSTGTVSGRYVMIRIEGQQYLHLAEVKVNGVLTTGGLTRADFAPVNIGQLKNVAKPFFDRLISIGYWHAYPWTQSGAAANDYAMANIGQAKQLFAFELPELVDLGNNVFGWPDSDSDGLPDWWETRHGFDPNNPDDAALDVDGDGLSALQEYQAGADPWNPDSDGDGYADGADAAPMDPNVQLPAPDPNDNTAPVIVVIRPAGVTQ